jgi:hypothetical protein
VKTIRSECLDQFIIFGEHCLRHLRKELVGYYLAERFHQGTGSQIIRPKSSPSKKNGRLGGIECRSCLGRLLKHYSLEAV